ncbi:hypothetical protein H2203_008140 [Taxawa tesnikishii (nom. ined.)]|nr:hypothetical protein H2203_008140 [Dothideales sp. JES 119]
MVWNATHIPFGITVPEARKIANPILKDIVEFTNYGIETDGAFFSIKCVVKPKGGAILHKHASYSENLKCLRGKMGIETGYGKASKTHIYGPGEEVHVAAGKWHRFFNPSETEDMEFEGTVTPAHQGFEIMLHIMYGLARDGLCNKDDPVPKSFVHACLTLAMAEVTFAQWDLWLVSQMAGAVRAWARWTGEEERLIKKYYGKPVGESDRKDL